MRGILYYPTENEENILQQIMKDLEIKKSDIKSETLHGKWNEIKRDYFADEKFIVHKDMYESCRETIEKIKSGEYKPQDFMYNPYRLYELISDYSYIMSTYGIAIKDKNKILDAKILTNFVEDLTKNGANLEEVKMMVLSSIFFNIDLMLDRVEEDYELVKAKMDNAMRLIRVIDFLERMSPYEEVFASAKVYRDEIKTNNSGETEFSEYCRVFDEFDYEILQYIARCKMKNYFLLSINRARYTDNLEDFLKNPLIREIYETRQAYEDNTKKAKGVFKYSIKDNFKVGMSALIQDKRSMKLLLELAYDFYYFGLANAREYEKVLTAGQVEFTCEEERRRRSDEERQ